MHSVGQTGDWVAHITVIMERYIEYFSGYRNAYGVADFNHQDSKIDPETGKKKPVYRWNFDELTN